MKKPRKIFFGWWINIVTSFLSSLIGGLTGAASLLFKPIAADLGLDRTGASVASGIGTLVNGGVFALAGWLTDKFGPKWVVLAGTCIASIGMLLLYFVESAWQYYIVWGFVIIVGLALSVSVSIDTMLTNWFVRKRGLAFSVRFGIIGVTSAMTLPLISWMIQSQGWRQTSLIWGFVVIACIPLMLVFVKPRRPEYYGLMPDGAELKKGVQHSEQDIITKGQEYAANIQETEYTFKQAIRTSAYWVINVSWVLVAIVSGGFGLHIVPYLTDRGISPIAAGGMLAMMTFFSIPSRILGGVIADRVKKEHIRFLMVGSLTLTSVGIAAIIISPTITGIYLLLVLFGLGLGAYTPLDILLRGRYFGRKAYGKIQGLSTVFSAPFAFASPIFAGWIYDTTGNYDIAFILFAVLAAAGAITMCFAKVPKALPIEKNMAQIGNIK
jgi:MFS family permease